MHSEPTALAPDALLEVPGRRLRLIVHELAKPMEGLFAMADLLSRQRLSPDADACLKSLVAGARDMGVTLADAAELSDAPPSAGTELLNLRLMMEAIAADPERRVLVAYEGDPEVSIAGDGARLRRVFDALIRHAQAGGRGRAIEAALVASVDGDCVRVRGRVRAGEGPGVDPGGSLPLAVAEAAVRILGGRLTLTANRGAGFTAGFEVDMPLSVEVAAPVQPPLEQSGLHVLIVDDNATNRLVAEAFCAMFGCTSESVCDGVEAVAAAGIRSFDVILMDIKMPRMDGVDATLAIRALPGPACRTPIIALTANADPEDVRRYIAAGMAGVVEKPIKAERLAEALNDLTAPFAPAHRAVAAA